ncbi:MAG TPA: hypothetical protein DCZ95_12585 [Verrucomicrobia bacterium]|nr:hypothetical protein [Verrucomicrobiota bacterium]
MATWPESNPTPVYPLIVSAVTQTNIVTLGGGGEQRRTNWLYPKFDVTVRYNALSASGAQTLWAFFLARQGAYEGFNIYDLSLLASVSFVHGALYCGTGNGTTSIFDIPGRSTSAQKVFVDGVEQTGVTILTGGGDGSSDRVQFAAPLAAGEIVTCSFTGYHRMRVRFEQDRISKELFMRNLFAYNSIALKGINGI